MGLFSAPLLDTVTDTEVDLDVLGVLDAQANLDLQATAEPEHHAEPEHDAEPEPEHDAEAAGFGEGATEDSEGHASDTELIADVDAETDVEVKGVADVNADVDGALDVDLDELATDVRLDTAADIEIGGEPHGHGGLPIDLF